MSADYLRRAAQAVWRINEPWPPGAAAAIAEWLEACADTWPPQLVVTTTPQRSRERRAAVHLAQILLEDPPPRHPDDD